MIEAMVISDIKLKERRYRILLALGMNEFRRKATTTKQHAAP